jgi:hypothetical protein
MWAALCHSRQNQAAGWPSWTLPIRPRSRRCAGASGRSWTITSCRRSAPGARREGTFIPVRTSSGRRAWVDQSSSATTSPAARLVRNPAVSSFQSTVRAERERGSVSMSSCSLYFAMFTCRKQISPMGQCIPNGRTSSASLTARYISDRTSGSCDEGHTCARNESN